MARTDRHFLSGQVWYYVEIQHPKTRFRIIDDEQLRRLVGLNDLDDLQESCRTGVEAVLK